MVDPTDTSHLQTMPQHGCNNHSGTRNALNCAEIRSFQFFSAASYTPKCSAEFNSLLRYRSIANKFVPVITPEVLCTAGSRTDEDRHRDGLPCLPRWFGPMQIEKADHYTIPTGTPSQVRPPKILPAAFLVVR